MMFIAYFFPQEWFVSITRDQCYSMASIPRECAHMLQHMDYGNILSIIMAKVRGVCKNGPLSYRTNKIIAI